MVWQYPKQKLIFSRPRLIFTKERSFLLKVNCKSTKEILQKDVKNFASKQIFARWQAILSVFDFEIEYLKSASNSFPDYLTREFL
ncbi:hypothetical protein CR513_39488, partial [Mucuna pruriens]